MLRRGTATSTTSPPARATTAATVEPIELDLPDDLLPPVEYASARAEEGWLKVARARDPERTPAAALVYIDTLVSAFAEQAREAFRRGTWNISQMQLCVDRMRQRATKAAFHKLELHPDSKAIRQRRPRLLDNLSGFGEIALKHIRDKAPWWEAHVAETRRIAAERAQSARPGAAPNIEDTTDGLAPAPAQNADALPRIAAAERGAHGNRSSPKREEPSPAERNKLVQQRAELLAKAMSAIGVTSKRAIYMGTRSPILYMGKRLIHEPEFKRWQNGKLPETSRTAIRFNKYLTDLVTGSKKPDA